MDFKYFLFVVRKTYEKSCVKFLSFNAMNQNCIKINQNKTNIIN